VFRDFIVLVIIILSLGIGLIAKNLFVCWWRATDVEREDFIKKIRRKIINE
jgi:hypothetical protein